MAKPPTGTWEFDLGGRRAWMEFKEDGTARQVRDDRETAVRWSLSGDVIEIRSAGMPIDKLTILSQRPGEMELESHGMKLRLRRVEAIPAMPADAPRIFQLITEGPCRLNGFDFTEPAMVNPFLIGKGNVLETEGARAEIVDTVIVDTETPRATFDTELAPLRSFLEKAEPIVEEDALRFADKLLRRLDPELFDAKVELYAEALAGDADPLRTELHEFLDGCFRRPGTEPVKEMVALPVCEQRIWEVRQKSGAPLLQAKPDPDGNIATLSVFVGRIDGRMQVVL